MFFIGEVDVGSSVCMARLGVVELNVVCSCWCVKVCCVDIFIGSVVCACEWD